MNKLVPAFSALVLCIGLTATAQAEQYSLECNGPGLGSSVKFAIDTGKKQVQIGGEAASDVAIDGTQVTAMKETDMYQIDLSNMQGSALTGDGFSNFECKRK